MREDFIHYLWKFKKLNGLLLKSTQGEDVVIKSLGTHNHHSGPDFFNCQITIGNQLWAGNVEMHIHSSDWYTHGHDDDPAYDNVILHVVWKHDAEITRRSEIEIPVLEVGPIVPDRLILSYTRLFAFKNNQFINCEKSIGNVDRFQIDMWLEKVYIQRLTARCIHIEQSLEQNKNDWEATFFQMLARSFGTKINADAFEQLANALDQSVLRKLASDAFQLEATFMGMTNLLGDVYKDLYPQQLLKEFAFAKAKFQLRPIHTGLKFFRLRPANYPTIRLSQLAMLYHRNPFLFGQVILAKNKEEIYQLFEVKAAKYWDDHHVFDKLTHAREKGLTKAFIDLVIINCLIPIKFAYSRAMGGDATEEVLALIRELPCEENKLVARFADLISIHNAMESQAVLQLKSYFCDRNRCLHCDVGVRLMQE